jgi:hypothetical protein
MNTTLIVILTIMAIVVLLAIYVSAWKCGCQAGIEYAMKYSVSRIVDEMRKGFDQMGYGEIFDKVVENTLNIEKLEQYKEE